MAKASLCFLTRLEPAVGCDPSESHSSAHRQRKVPHAIRPCALTSPNCGAEWIGHCCLVIGGCSNNDTATQSSSSDFETVTIESALGNAVITEKPERIVTLGMGSAETVIALGTIPVGVEKYAWGSDDTGICRGCTKRSRSKVANCQSSSPAEPISTSRRSSLSNPT